MSERFFRIVLGTSLLAILYLNSTNMPYAQIAVYTYIGVLLFEGITNLRIPILVSRLRYGEYVIADKVCAKIPFDAERALRLVVAIFLIGTFGVTHPPLLLIESNTLTYFFPWFIGFMLAMAGITNICPMVMFLRWTGMR